MQQPEALKIISYIFHYKKYIKMIIRDLHNKYIEDINKKEMSDLKGKYLNSEQL